MLLPNPDNVIDLVARLQKWRSHQEDYQKLVLSLSQELRNYTWDDMAKSIWQIIS
ncbi:hypothetical protein QHH11_13960 [Aphanizomenon sp. PH219]|nr:hypothetical protein [Aphanizomenon sp. PH219]